MAKSYYEEHEKQIICVGAHNNFISISSFTFEELLIINLMRFNKFRLRV